MELLKRELLTHVQKLQHTCRDATVASSYEGIKRAFESIELKDLSKYTKPRSVIIESEVEKKGSLLTACMAHLEMAKRHAKDGDFHFSLISYADAQNSLREALRHESTGLNESRKQSSQENAAQNTRIIENCKHYFYYRVESFDFASTKDWLDAKVKVANEVYEVYTGRRVWPDGYARHKGSKIGCDEFVNYLFVKWPKSDRDHERFISALEQRYKSLKAPPQSSKVALPIPSNTGV